MCTGQVATLSPNIGRPLTNSARDFVVEHVPMLGGLLDRFGKAINPAPCKRGYPFVED
jgi:hypothetical protein